CARNSNSAWFAYW
nr:immunoglobulin heavy chain junction region [Mus musculus]